MRCPHCGKEIRPNKKYAEAIDYYYQQRANGSIITLRIIAARRHLSYTYLRKYKSVYDKGNKQGNIL